MLDFPKQYKQIKTNIDNQQKSQTNRFFFLPELYKNNFDIDQIFRLFVLDTLHTIYYGEKLNGGYFLPDTLFYNKEISKTNSLKKQLKQFGLNNFTSGLQINQDLSFQFRLQNFFADNFVNGNFLEDRFLVYWSPKHQTPICLDLVDYIPSNKKRYTIKYFVSTKNHSLDVITDSPETIFGDVAIAIHPQNKKAKQLKGQEAIIPIINKTIPIIVDERADFTRYGGIYRVTPGHDKLGLEIAKDHNLPIDTYAIDKDGFFTENAGLFKKKPAEDFFTNIIQSLSDIGNLTKTESFDGEIPVCHSNGEHLIFRAWKGFFVKMDEEFISKFFEQEKIKEISLGRNIIDNTYRLASSHQKGGIPLPIWANKDGKYLINSEWFIKAYKEIGAKNGIAFGLFILHCISTKLLPAAFSAEEFVTMIFEIEQENISNFFDLLTDKYPKTKKEFDELTKDIQSLDKEKSLIKNTEQLLDLLDKSFCLAKTTYGKYRFAFEKFDKNMTDIEQYDQTISRETLNTFLLIEKANKPIDFFANQNRIKSAVKNILFAEYYTKENFVNKIHKLPYLEESKENLDCKRSDMTKSYHPDCIRIGFLSLANRGNKYGLNIFSERDQSISKFWNACRYIKTTFFGGSKKIDFKKIEKDLEKNISEFSAFDSWILSKLASLVEEFKQIKEPEQIGIFASNVFNFIQHDFSEKYLELIKSAPSDYSNNISLCTVKIILDIIFPYMPIITDQLYEIFGFDRDLDNEKVLNAFKNIQKNYSISLFMEIIDRFGTIKTSLGLKKHDLVSIFIRSNPDFLKFAKNNESLFKKTLHAEDVIYLVHHENIPTGYKQEDIIDISIGLKGGVKPKISGIILLQKQLQEKEEYLQHIKNIVQELSSSGSDSDVIQSKRDEISKIKKDIDNINFEISKCKIKE